MDPVSYCATESIEWNIMLHCVIDNVELDPVSHYVTECVECVT